LSVIFPGKISAYQKDAGNQGIKYVTAGGH